MCRAGVLRDLGLYTVPGPRWFLFVLRAALRFGFALASLCPGPNTFGRPGPLWERLTRRRRGGAEALVVV